MSKNYKDAQASQVERVRRLMELKQLKKALEDEISEIEDGIKNELEVGDVLISDGVELCELKEITRNTVDSTRLKVENVQVYNAYLKASTFKQLRLISAG